MKINGNTLLGWGFTPGPHFKEAIAAADALARSNHFQGTNYTEQDMIDAVRAVIPAEPLKLGLQDPETVPLHLNIDANTDFEKRNLAAAKSQMQIIRQVPVVRAAALMPDACPSGVGVGLIPVGGVAYAENAIVPGMHSADICCSMAYSLFSEDTDPKDLMDAGSKICHFGKGGRPYSNDIVPSDELLDLFEKNPYLSNKAGVAQKHFGSSGDGNHHYFVGRLESTGQVALVTHWGSRKPGAMLYDVGIDLAERHTKKICPEVSKYNAWINFDSQEGQDYWAALQLIRRWTKGSHFAVHDAVARAVGEKVRDRFWNEHNFVFRRTFNGKEYFAHAKGATPAYAGFAPDTLGRTLVPLNMASPVLITQVNQDYDFGMNFSQDTSLGFSPHGAGRNYSRTEFIKNLTERGILPKQMIADVTAKYDIRAFSGKHDISEFPEAYKNADQIIAGIEKFKLARVVDKILPHGSIMAGHDGIDYKELKRKKRERAEKLKEGF